jgi:protein-tyrosine-phosphatase
VKYALFVCTQNAGRSQMAQALFERHAPADIDERKPKKLTCRSAATS